MALNLFSQTKTTTTLSEEAGHQTGKIDGNLSGREEAIKATKSDYQNRQQPSKVKENISDFLLDQKNLKNLTTEQVKLYHEVLGSPEFKVALNSVDSKGQTLAETLNKLITSNLDRGLVNALDKSEAAIKTELLTSILDKVKTNGFTNQGTKNTCLIAAVESQAFNDNPAEVSRLVTELATKGRYEIQRGSQKLAFNLPTEHLGKEEPNSRHVPRNAFDQIFQEASAITLLKAVGGDVASYDSSNTGWSIQNSSGQFIDLSGKFAIQGELLHSMLTGQGHAILSREADASKLVSATRSTLENLQLANDLSYDPSTKTLTGCDFKEGILVHLRWAPDGSDHAKHCVKAMGIYTDPSGEKFVILGNSHNEELNFKPSSIIEINRGSPPHQRLEMMPLTDFQNRLEEAHIPDKSGIVTIAEVRASVMHSVDNCETSSYRKYKGVYMLTISANSQFESTSDRYQVSGQLEELKNKQPVNSATSSLNSGSQTAYQLKDTGLSEQEIQLRLKNTNISKDHKADWQYEVSAGGSVTRIKNYVMFGHTADDTSLFAPYKPGKN